MKLDINISLNINGESFNIPVSTDTIKSSINTKKPITNIVKKEEDNLSEVLPISEKETIAENLHEKYDINLLDYSDMENITVHELANQFLDTYNKIIYYTGITQGDLSNKLQISQGRLSSLVCKQGLQKMRNKTVVSALNKLQNYACVYMK